MTALHKISMDFYASEYALIALHTSLEDYALAYWLNKHLKTKFKRHKRDLDLNTEATFSVFDWHDLSSDSYWTLLSNKHLSFQHHTTQDLFTNAALEKKQSLIPEHKGVDFFLKIEEQGFLNIKELVVKLKQLPVIVTAFTVDQNQLKSKNNLIF
jgi:hypothetical protein|tara:strand:- start:6685 stop:7149 length:465 start_codon:yes stop_codon:yes gene_type:complete